LKKNLLIVAALAAVVVVPTTADAQVADQEAALFIGYSYMNVGQEFADRGGSHGVAADYTFFMDRRFGFVLSASAHFGTVDAAANPFQISDFRVRQYSFLAGPHATLWRTLTSELGLRGMAGAASRTTEGANTGIDFGDEWAFAAAAEAHLDFRLSDHIWLRAIQPTAMWTNFDNGWQFNWRLAAGFVLHAGEILQ
jgi:hypothetical protein